MTWYSVFEYLRVDYRLLILIIRSQLRCIDNRITNHIEPVSRPKSFHAFGFDYRAVAMKWPLILRRNTLRHQPSLWLQFDFYNITRICNCNRNWARQNCSLDLLNQSRILTFLKWPCNPLSNFKIKPHTQPRKNDLSLQTCRQSRKKLTSTFFRYYCPHRSKQSFVS